MYIFSLYKQGLSPIDFSFSSKHSIQNIVGRGLARSWHLRLASRYMLKSICEYTAEQRHTQVTQVQWVRGHVALCRSRSPRRLAPICGLALQPTPRVARRPPPFKNLPVSNAHKTECEPPLELRSAARITRLEVILIFSCDPAPRGSWPLASPDLLQVSCPQWLGNSSTSG